MKQRVLSALVFVPIILIFIYLGGFPLVAGVTFLTLVGLKEFCDIAKKKNVVLPYEIIVFLGILFALSTYPGVDLQGFAIVVSFIAMTLYMLKSEMPFSGFAIALTGIMYIAFGFSFLTLIRGLENGMLILLLCFLIPWITDALAYFVGIKFGQHKMAPHISPKKSWEGAIGGTLFCVILCMIFNQLVLHLPFAIMLFTVFFASILGQIGDLFESWLKRWAGVKDSGKLIPGHGGILDRFDSLLFVAPFVYYMLRSLI